MANLRNMLLSQDFYFHQIHGLYLDCLDCKFYSVFQNVLELDMSLSRKPTRGVGETVSRALKQVCHENNFKKFEISYKTALKVCKHIKGTFFISAIFGEHPRYCYSLDVGVVVIVAMQKL